MFCRRCRYNLFRTKDPRCPECGGAFTPGDPSTALPKGDRWTWLKYQAEVWGSGMRERGAHDGRMFCKECFADLRHEVSDHCPVCGAWFRRQDSDTYVRRNHALDRMYQRFKHICIWRGVLIPLIPLWIGLEAVITMSTVLPRLQSLRGGGYIHLYSWPAVAMGIAWLGIALILHCRYFWGYIERSWQFAEVAQLIGVVLVVGGWGYAILWAFGVTWG